MVWLAPPTGALPIRMVNDMFTVSGETTFTHVG